MFAIHMRWRVFMFALCGLYLGACATDGAHDAQRGFPTGAGAEKGRADQRAVIGGMADSTVGAVIAQYMDKQADELKRLADAQRVEDGIIVTLNEKILFNSKSVTLDAQARGSLRRLAGVFKKYDKTNLTVVGHTDNHGAADFNIRLSERRAKSVADYLISLGISPQRIRIMGLGLERPLADNGTLEGRARNRRVEIHIAPNSQLRDEDQSQRS
jgi:outer membrane protein OmpA-like peptidoglycan-associated protein